MAEQIDKNTPLVMVTVGQFADYLVTNGLLNDTSRTAAKQTGSEVHDKDPAEKTSDGDWAAS